MLAITKKNYVMVTVHSWRKNKRVAFATQDIEKAKKLMDALCMKYYGRTDVSSGRGIDINLFHFADQWATYLD